MAVYLHMANSFFSAVSASRRLVGLHLVYLLNLQNAVCIRSEAISVARLLSPIRNSDGHQNFQMGRAELCPSGGPLLGGR